VAENKPEILGYNAPMPRRFQFSLAGMILLPFVVSVLCVVLRTVFPGKIDGPFVIGVCGGALAWIACAAWLKPFKRK
jgi:hypothetical protein